MLHVDGLNLFVDHLDLLEKENRVCVDVQELQNFIQLLELIEEDLELQWHFPFGGFSDHLQPLEVSHDSPEVHFEVQLALERGRASELALEGLELRLDVEIVHDF